MKQTKPTVQEMFERAAEQVGFRIRCAGASTLLEPAPTPRRRKVAKHAKRNRHPSAKR